MAPKVGVELGLPTGKADGATVARHYKHAAGKSSTYAPEVVDMIYHMARAGHMPDDDVCAFVGAKLGAEREVPAKQPAPTFDQLVFLSANLTRLVIDPYREKCNSKVVIGPTRERPLRLDWPIVFGGVDLARLPERLRDWTRRGAAEANLAAVVSPDDAGADGETAPMIVRSELDDEPGDAASAAARLITAATASRMQGDAIVARVDALRARAGGPIPIGVEAPAHDAARIVDETIDCDLDFYVADAQWTSDARPTSVFPELERGPQIEVLADVVERVRAHRSEHRVQVIYSGGVRGGADAGKAMCLGATAVSLGLSAVIGMGFRITGLKDEATLLEAIEEPLDDAGAVRHLVNFAKSVNIEITMLARACGKSSVTNMEPEDLRALTVAVSAATGIPVAGKDYRFRSEGGD